MVVLLHTFIGILRLICYCNQQTSEYEVVKGKAIPIEAWTGPEGPRSLRLPDFKTIGT
jgi:hypothetical protein